MLKPVVSDSRADIFKAGKELLEFPGQYIKNILPLGISPRTVNGLSMTPFGRRPVTIKLGKAEYKDNFHIILYIPRSIQVTLCCGRLLRIYAYCLQVTPILSMG